MRLVGVLAVAALAACGGKKDAPAGGGGSAAAKADDVTTCDGAIGHSVDAMIAKKEQQAGSALPPERKDRLERLRGTLTGACTADKWPAAMLTCVASVAAQPDLMKCISTNLDGATAQRTMIAIGGAMMGGRFGGPRGTGMMGGSAGAASMDIDAMFQTRLAAMADKMTAANAALAAAAPADKAARQADVERLQRETAALQTQYAEIKQMHGGPLQMNNGGGSASASATTGSAAIGSAAIGSAAVGSAKK